MLLSSDTKEEEDSMIPSDHLTEAHNHDGHPTGCIIKHSQAQELARKQAVNLVIIE